MQYIQRYMELYPMDNITLIGGAAAFLQLQNYGRYIQLNDIDVNISTKESGKTILERWLAIVPSSYIANYDTNYIISFFTLMDSNKQDLSIDVFVNEQYIYETESIGQFKVETIDRMISRYYSELTGRRLDIQLISSGLIKWDQTDLQNQIDKYNRLLERLRLLIECQKHKINNK